VIHWFSRQKTQFSGELKINLTFLYTQVVPSEFLVLILPFLSYIAIISHKKWRHLTEIVINEQNLAFLSKLYFSAIQISRPECLLQNQSN
jgi:hypothetical protein